MENPVITTMLNRRSVRKYTTQQPTDEVLEAVVRAGQQAPFAAQMYSILLNRKKKNPFNAPLLFTFCVDMHKLELIMARRGWKTVSNDLSILLFGIQDAAYAAQNMVIAAESFGMGSCYLGVTPYYATRVQKTLPFATACLPAGRTDHGLPR